MFCHKHTHRMTWPVDQSRVRAYVFYCAPATIIEIANVCCLLLRRQMKEDRTVCQAARSHARRRADGASVPQRQLLITTAASTGACRSCISYILKRWDQPPLWISCLQRWLAIHFTSDFLGWHGVPRSYDTEGIGQLSSLKGFNISPSVLHAARQPATQSRQIARQNTPISGVRHMVTRSKSLQTSISSKTWWTWLC